MDLNQLEASAGATFDVTVGTNSDTKEPVGFRVLGPFSDRFAEVTRRQQLRNIALSTRRPANGLAQTADERDAAIARITEEHLHDMVVSCTVDWFGFTVSGAKAEFSRENFDRVLKARQPWILRIADAIAAEENFTKA